jgi:hypothetical protein
VQGKGLMQKMRPMSCTGSTCVKDRDLVERARDAYDCNDQHDDFVSFMFTSYQNDRDVSFALSQFINANKYHKVSKYVVYSAEHVGAL